MGRVAYLFPGQGSQEVGMGRAFAERSSAAAQVFEDADHALGEALTTLIASGPAETLALTENTQPAVLVASIAALEAGREAGLPPPDFVAGHSLGEYSALVAARALSLAQAVKLVRLRGRLMQAAVPVGEGGMSAVLGLPVARVAQACQEIESENPGSVVAPANLNGSDQIVIAGHVEALRLAGDRCRQFGARRVIPLDVSAPFHSSLMASVSAPLADALASSSFADARIPVVTNVDALPEQRADRLRSLLVAQVTAPVRWTDVVARLVAEGCDTFIELGPGTVLTGLVRRQVPGARVHAIFHPSRLEAACAALVA